MPNSTLSKIGSFAGSRKGRTALVSLGAVAVLAIGGTTWAYQASANDVDLSVDGKDTQVSSRAETVGDLLQEQGIDLGEHDFVAPAAGTPLEDGSAVTVQYGRQLTLDVDGSEKSYWVTSRSVDRALDEIGRTFPRHADFSTSRSATIGREGLEVEVVTPKTITVALAGEKPQKKTVTALTVRDALADLEVDVEGRDKLSLKPGREIEDGDKIVFTDFEQKLRSFKGQSVGYNTVERSDDSMYEGEEKVQREGRDGTRNVTYRVLLRNGEVVKRVETKSTVTKKPVNRIVLVGTKERPAPEPTDTGTATGSAPAGVWGALAQCESGGNPNAVNPAGPYYGLYQFTASTWASVGGSGVPTDHDAAEQTKRAQILQARSGWGQWPACAASLGLL